MTLEINFKTIDTETSKKIHHFILEQAKTGVKIWSTQEIYSLEDGTEFKFKNNLFQRKRKNGKEGVRYELVSNKEKLGEGGYGEVRKIKRTLALDKNGIHSKKEGKNGQRRAVKKQEHSKRNSLSALQNEYELTERADQLHIKEPTLSDDSKNATSYTVMMLAPGKEIFDIINEDRLKTEVLTTKQRLDLSVALLRAVKERLTSREIIHRDLKPDNIFVKLDELPIKITILDYGLAMDVNKLAEKTRGSPCYLAPELLEDPLNASYKADVFSIARIITLVWGASNDTYDSTLFEDSSDAFALTTTQRLENLFSGINDIGFGLQTLIVSTLQEMLETDPEYRSSIDEAIDLFSSFEIEEQKQPDSLINPTVLAENKVIPLEKRASSTRFSFFKSHRDSSDDSYESSDKIAQNLISHESSNELQFC
ncbi:MAG: protein kinase [Tatlockia sp.]|nr:protein kinase [Tatlockia sp.]